MRRHSIHEIEDIDGNQHHIVIRYTQDRTKFSASEWQKYGAITSQDFDKPEDALKDIMSNINLNCAKSFETELDATAQQELLSYISSHFQAGTRGNAKLCSSYYLKHIVERNVSSGYISNGQLKGAMQKAGFERHKSTSPNCINYNYSLKKLKE